MNLSGILWHFMHLYASITNSLKTCICICKYSIAFNPLSSDNVFQRLSEKYIRYDKKKVVGVYTFQTYAWKGQWDSNKEASLLCGWLNNKILASYNTLLKRIVVEFLLVNCIINGPL